MSIVEGDLANRVFEIAPGLRGMYDRYSIMIDGLIRGDHVRRSDIEGKRILDWECGAGVFSLIFAERGAAQCEAIDSWLWTEECRRAMGHIDRIRFDKVSLEAYAGTRSRDGEFDLVFANTVTEHMLNLPQQLPLVRRLLKPGGLFITNHDNYYQPVGSHDHGFLYYGEGPQIVRQGPACWEAAERCEASKDHRLTVMKNLWWTWDEAMERRLTPHDCTQCPYYKRSQPWAHLRHQHEFREVFRHVGFTTGYPKSSLNKLTLFQLRQFVIEAGFDIVGWVANRVLNEPPEDLTSPPFNFSRDDLQTCTVTVVARRAESPYDEDRTGP